MGDTVVGWWYAGPSQNLPEKCPGRVVVDSDGETSCGCKICRLTMSLIFLKGNQDNSMKMVTRIIYVSEVKKEMREILKWPIFCVAHLDYWHKKTARR